MKAKFLSLTLLLPPMLGACTSTSEGGATATTGPTGTHVNGDLHLDFDNGVLVVTAPGKPDAHIAPNGDLRIGDSAVALTPSQRETMRHLYAKAADVRDDGIAAGKAGVQLGADAVSNVVESLFSKDHSAKDPDMQANSSRVETAARKLCSDLVQVQSTQTEAAAQLPAFKPYAVFRGEIHCDKKIAGTGTDKSSPTPQAQ